MQIARVCRAIRWAAPTCCVAPGQEIQSEMDAQRTLFVEGAAKNNVEDARASMIFARWRSSRAIRLQQVPLPPYALVAYQRPT